MMHAILKVGVLVCAVFFTSVVQNREAMADAALYIDGDRGDKWGWAVDYPSVSQAMARAKRECGDDCRHVMAYRAGCGAWAADQAPGSTAWGWALGETASETRGKALSYCRDRGGEKSQCIVRVWGCNSVENSSLAKHREKKRIVLVSMRLSTNHRYDESEFSQRSVLYCGYTEMSASEAAAYGETIDRVPSSSLRPEGSQYAYFLTTEGHQLSGIERHRLDASPIAQRFLKEVMKDRYFSQRHVRTPEGLGGPTTPITVGYSTNGYEHNYNRFGSEAKSFERLYEGVHMILPSAKDYSTYRDIVCGLPVQRYTKMYMATIDIGRF